MKKLIIHLEYPDDLQEGDLTLDIDDLLENLRSRLTVDEDMGWRYFGSLEAAKEWEIGPVLHRFNPG